MAYRINVTLDNGQAAKLARLAAQMRTDERDLARTLLSSALDDADPDPRQVVAVLDGIPGAWERTQRAREQARRGETIDLAEL